MNFKRLAAQAKKVVDARGGVEGLKEDAARLREAASKPGSAKEKAEAARDALTKRSPTPGAEESPASTSAAETRASSSVDEGGPVVDEGPPKSP